MDTRPDHITPARACACGVNMKASVASLLFILIVPSLFRLVATPLWYHHSITLLDLHSPSLILLIKDLHV